MGVKLKVAQLGAEFACRIKNKSSTSSLVWELAEGEGGGGVRFLYFR